MTLKSSIKNIANPEGSIAEWYIANESITYCSLHFDGVETKFNRAIRNDDKDTLFSMEKNLYLMQNLLLLIALGHPIGNVCSKPVCDKTLAQAHRYVLYNCDTIARFIK